MLNSSLTDDNGVVRFMIHSVAYLRISPNVLLHCMFKLTQAFDGHTIRFISGITYKNDMLNEQRKMCRH